MGFFLVVYGWRLGWWKENSMPRVFAFMKDRENGWICQRKRTIGMKETVCLQFWWSEYGEGTGRGRIASLFFCFFHRVFIAYLSSCFFLCVFIASLSIWSPLYFYLCVLFNFNRLFFVIYNGRVLNDVVAFPNNIIYCFLIYMWLNSRWTFFLT